MRKALFTLLLSTLFIVSAWSQTTLLSTGFENGDFDEGWTIGVSQAITELPGEYGTNLEPWEKWAVTDDFRYVHTGTYGAWIGGTLYQETTHDWLMTPEIEIPVNGETQLYYWLWYHSEQQYTNYFYIMVYDLETEAWEQVYLLGNAFNSPYHYTEEYSFDLTPWAGKQIKLAFVKNGTYQMAMDDIRVEFTPSVNVSDKTTTKTFNLYPNPAKDIVTIDVTDIADDKQIIVTNVLGNVVMTKTIDNNHTTLSVSDLSKGVYFVKIGESIQKLTIQ